MSQARRRKTGTNRKLIIAGLREILFIFFCFAGLYLFVSLLTYDPLDPGLWDSGAEVSEIKNRGGVVGAFFADSFFNLFGYFAYLFAYMTGYIGWLIYQGKEEIFSEPKELIIPGIGFLLTLSAGCGLAIVHFSAETALLPSHAGGMLGQLIGPALQKVLSQLGSTLLLLTLFFTGITMLTGLSWLKLMDFLGKHTLRFLPRLGAAVRRYIFPFLGKHTVTFLRRTGRMLANLFKRAGRVFKRRGKDDTKLAGESGQNGEISDEDYFSPTEPPATLLQSRQEDSDGQATGETGGYAEIAGIPVQFSLSLLDAPPPGGKEPEKPDLKPMFMRVQMALQVFSVEAKVKGVYPGPVLSRVEIKPGKDKFDEVAAISDKLIQRLAIPGVHVRETTPGMLSLEIPNAKPQIVYFSKLLQSKTYLDNRSPLGIALGKDVVGNDVVIDLARLPHLMIAGSNSTDINRVVHSIILSLMYKTGPTGARFILMDSAYKALSPYAGMPHLFVPLLHGADETLRALRWCINEMERRYRLMADLGVRNIGGYNESISETEPPHNPEGFAVHGTPLPYIVIVLHEFSELLANTDKQAEAEELLTRLTQKARAAGIHLILATQQPSVTVISGLMKTNFPTRLAFQVGSKAESRTVLGRPGAESLLGNGDMFYLTPGTAVPARLHGVQLSVDEVHKVCAELRDKYGEPVYAELKEA